MSSPGAERRDFFVSFNSADRAWAEWIAAELEAAGYTTFFQHWDFRPGSNFVLEMHKAAALADRTIAVLSPDYLKALFTQPEWAAALVLDPTGSRRTLVPVRVEECSPDGILKPIVYADLVGLDEEAARKTLLSAVSGDRPKPSRVPFPAPAGARKQFPPKIKSTPLPTPLPTPAPKKPLPPNTSLPFVWFALALVLVVAMVANAGKLVAFGLVNQLYYLVLVASGLAAAIALFTGLRRSSALYSGKGPWGALELGGPVVVFALVVLGGALFAPNRGPFALTVFLRGPNGEILARSEGRVMLHLGPDARVESIGEKGTASFAGVPAEFRGQDVAVTLEAEGFERAETGKVKLAGESLYLPVRRRAGRLYGVVEDGGGHPVAGAMVDAGGTQTMTSQDGRFELAVAAQQVVLRVLAKGFVTYRENVTPGGNEMTIPLTAEPLTPKGGQR